MYTTIVRSGRAVAGGLSSNPLVSAIVFLVLVLGLAFVFTGQGASGTIAGKTSQQGSVSGLSLSPDMGPDMFHG